MPEFKRSKAARRLARGRDFAARLDRYRAARVVRHRDVLRCKRRVLELLSRSLADESAKREAAFRRFLERRPDVLDYARFRAAGEKLRAPWQAWPSPAHDGSLRAADVDPEVERYHAYAQWLAQEQLERLAGRSGAAGVDLYLDLPLGVHPSGYDVYRHRGLFVPGFSVGAPPDSFFVRGQSWGFPPLHPQRQRDDRYRYLISALRHQMRWAHTLRIDHVMWLSRLFLVPDGAGPSEGAYIRYPEEELYAILCLEAERAGCELIGEDLGTVPPEVRERMDRHGVRRMYVLPLEFRDASPPLPDPPSGCVAALNTHDMPTFASFWSGRDIRDRRALGLLDKRGADRERRSRGAMRQAIVRQLRSLGHLSGRATSHRVLQACLRFLASSEASLVIVNLEDLWLEMKQQNVPGTGPERPNWKRKARLALEELTLSRLEGANALRAARPGSRKLRPRRRADA